MFSESGYFMDFLEIRERKDKPREEGLTFIGDTGSPLPMIEDALEIVCDYVDLVKLVMCSGRLCKKDFIKKKVKLYERYDVFAFPGGVLGELALVQNKFHEFLRELQEVGFGVLEISASEMKPPTPGTIYEMVEIASKDYGFKVLGEIGVHRPIKKLKTDETIHEIKKLKESGAWKVILEGAELQLLGIGKENRGTEVLKNIVDAVGCKDLFFETQMDLNNTNWLIENFGPDVNLGNVCFSIDVEAIFDVESARRMMIQRIKNAGIASADLKL